MNHGFLSCKHKTLESVAPWDTSVAVSHIQKLIPKGKGLRETTIRSMNHQSYSPVVKHFTWLWWSPTASEALWSKLKNFPRGACTQTLLEPCMCVIQKNSARCARRMAVPTPLYVCPPLLQPLDPPLMTAPICSANCLPCEALGIDAWFHLCP